MERFNKKYRIETTRLRNWDYAWMGSYFITINTKDQQIFFGDVIEDEMVHNQLGLIAVAEWLKSPEIRPDMNITLGEFVVMPDHFHGLITIAANDYNRKPSLRDDSGKLIKKLSPQKKNISSIIRGFKSAVTKQVRLIDPSFAWQDKFHDHLIRSEEEYKRRTLYMRNNPRNWRKKRRRR